MHSKVAVNTNHVPPSLTYGGNTSGFLTLVLTPVFSNYGTTCHFFLSDSGKHRKRELVGLPPLSTVS